MVHHYRHMKEELSKTLSPQFISNSENCKKISYVTYFSKIKLTSCHQFYRYLSSSTLVILKGEKKFRIINWYI